MTSFEYHAFVYFLFLASEQPRAVSALFVVAVSVLKDPFVVNEVYPALNSTQIAFPEANSATMTSPNHYRHLILFKWPMLNNHK